MKNLSIKTIIPYVIIVLLMIGTYFYYNNAQNANEKFDNEVKLKTALLDSLSYYINKEKELVAEKKTLQATIRDLSDKNNNLTSNQKELVKRVDELKKDKQVITAALIQSRADIDSLINEHGVVNDKDSSITFSDKTPFIEYEFKVSHVLTMPLKKPILSFEKLTLPNKQFIEFHWEKNKRENYPISFSVSNSNKYFTTTNIDSYAIPELIKPDIKPNFWDKTGKFLGKSGKIAIYVGIGAGAMYLLK